MIWKPFATPTELWSDNTNLWNKNKNTENQNQHLQSKSLNDLKRRFWNTQYWIDLLDSYLQKRYLREENDLTPLFDYSICFDWNKKQTPLISDNNHPSLFVEIWKAQILQHKVSRINKRFVPNTQNFSCLPPRPHYIIPCFHNSNKSYSILHAVKHARDKCKRMEAMSKLFVIC